MPALVALLLLLGLAGGVSAVGMPAGKGDRLLGIHVNPARGEAYDGAMRYAKGLGIDFTVLTLKWGAFEREPGRLEDPGGLLSVADAYYPANGVKVLLELASPINTTVRGMPPDLEGRPFDDPEAVRRFGVFLEFVLARLPRLDLVGLVIGNEVDVYLRAHPDEAAAFLSFFDAARARARALRPGLRAGATLTVAGATDGLPSGAGGLLRAGDFLGLTYYPLNDDYSVKDPSVVRGDFARLCAATPGRPLFFQECGYPASALLGGSEGRQARFYSAVFAAWDEFRSRIGLIAFYELSDWSPGAVSEYLVEIRAAETPGLAEYVRTLGLRDYDTGRPRAAAAVLASEAAARGW